MSPETGRKSWCWRCFAWVYPQGHGHPSPAVPGGSMSDPNAYGTRLDRAVVDAFQKTTTRQKADLMSRYPDLYFAVAKWAAHSLDKHGKRY